ncbi:hypothetical protein [Agaribacter flavus]|uniref:Uncharacterized protein n=1 Tax=Agaribacter flavus TaxID=1902781 RepID=A0ABV7FU21_9ALTE
MKKMPRQKIWRIILLLGFCISLTAVAAAVQISLDSPATLPSDI